MSVNYLRLSLSHLRRSGLFLYFDRTWDGLLLTAAWPHLSLLGVRRSALIAGSRLFRNFEILHLLCSRGLSLRLNLHAVTLVLRHIHSIFAGSALKVAARLKGQGPHVSYFARSSYNYFKMFKFFAHQGLAEARCLMSAAPRRGLKKILAVKFKPQFWSDLGADCRKRGVEDLGRVWVARFPPFLACTRGAHRL